MNGELGTVTRVRVRWGARTHGVDMPAGHVVPVNGKNYGTRFDRQRRLLERCVRFLVELNHQSDALYYPAGEEQFPRRRGPAAQRQYDVAKKLIGAAKRGLAR